MSGEKTASNGKQAWDSEKAKEEEAKMECLCGGEGRQTGKPKMECLCGGNGLPEEEFVYDPNPYWVTDQVKTPAGDVPRISTRPDRRDKRGALAVRWGFNRMGYRVKPGLYCTGEADRDSPVLVTSNYKLTFDLVRQAMDGFNAWILVLDTRGVNVWCAAGKGTFGTAELVNRIDRTGLGRVVAHRTLVLPQLGATGVSAHAVRQQSGFRVVYGPVRVSDVPEFLKAGMKATREMRTVRFDLRDRMAVVPVEVTRISRWILPLLILDILLGLTGVLTISSRVPIAVIGAIIAGCVLVPALLPWIPGRAFALKGWILGLIWAGLVGLSLFAGHPDKAFPWSAELAYLLVLPPISAFFAMGFTGSSTYTSLSGVKREMKAAIPAMAVSFVAGLIVRVVILI